jgi:hypothetical protein
MRLSKENVKIGFFGRGLALKLLISLTNEQAYANIGRKLSKVNMLMVFGNQIWCRSWKIGGMEGFVLRLSPKGWILL